jgi:hypothetical protein
VRIDALFILGQVPHVNGGGTIPWLTRELLFPNRRVSQSNVGMLQYQKNKRVAVYTERTQLWQRFVAMLSTQHLPLCPDGYLSVPAATSAATQKFTYTLL